MSGMLPGVECARRRRLHNSASTRDPTTRSLCLYIRNLHNNNSSSSSLLACPDENLEGAALKAKRRLDQKFMAPMKLQNQRPHYKCKGLLLAFWSQLRS
ncbi:hypothetical protein VNO78_23373 [Psophocarpus tetragonolobus]|uniref:Uncharacterized protein n=1 Tax=Psophocarpus tetragonolobus TaxID=3891 RepID=A0AAN9S6I7_PSOTE